MLGNLDSGQVNQLIGEALVASLFQQQRKRSRAMTPKQIEAAVKIEGFKVKEEGGVLIASFKGKQTTIGLASKRVMIEGCFGWIADVMNGRA